MSGTPPRPVPDDGRPRDPRWRRWLGTLHLVYAFAIFLTVMVVLLPIMVVPVALAGARGQWASHLGLRLWAASFWLFGVGFRERGVRRHLPRRGGALIVANHSSLLDSPALYWALGRPFRPLGKAELARLPVFGLIYRHAVIVVDRGRGASRAASLTAIARELSAGRVVVVFAEGSMSPRIESGIRPLQPGTLLLARRLGVPILPLGIRGSGPMLPAATPMRLRPGIIRLTLGPPIPDTVPPEALSEEVREALAGLTGLGVA